MYRYLALFLLAIALLPCSSHAQATTTQCNSVAVPAGWVTISISTNSACGIGTNNQRTIENIATLPTGSQPSACNDGIPVPSGYVITGFTTDTTNCGSNGTNNRYTLLNLNGEPSGFSTFACFQSTIPGAWVTTDTPTNSVCGTGTGNGRNILNASGMALNATLTVCAISNVPPGWAIISTGTNGSICGGLTGDIRTIQNQTPPPPPHATMQTDGNFVVIGSSGSVIFATNTAGTGAVIIKMQDDGNLVVYKEIWQAGTYAASSPGPFPPQTCTIGTILHAPQQMAEGQCITSPKGQYMLYLAPGGNMFIYDIAHNIGTWGTGITGQNGSYASLQTDGNFVEYSAGNVALWNSGTYGSGVTLLDMEDDGRIILYKPIWWSNTSQGWVSNNFAHPACDVGLGTGWTGVLGVNQCFVSPNGRYELLLQPDGILVLYDRSFNPIKPLWIS